VKHQTFTLTKKVATFDITATSGWLVIFILCFAAASILHFMLDWDGVSIQDKWNVLRSSQECSGALYKKESWKRSSNKNLKGKNSGIIFAGDCYFVDFSWMTAFATKKYITINPCFGGIVAVAICFPGEDASLQLVCFLFNNPCHSYFISFFAGDCNKNKNNN